MLSRLVIMSKYYLIQVTTCSVPSTCIFLSSISKIMPVTRDIHMTLILIATNLFLFCLYFCFRDILDTSASVKPILANTQLGSICLQPCHSHILFNSIPIRPLILQIPYIYNNQINLSALTDTKPNYVHNSVNDTLYALT